MILLSLVACLNGGGAKSGDIVLLDEHNYSYTVDLDIATTEVELANDFTIEWSGLTRDMLGHDVSPTDIDVAWFMWFRNLTQEELAQGLAENTITQVDVDWAASAMVTGDTSTETSVFDFGGNPYDAPTYFASEQGAYLVRVTTGTDQYAPTRALAFVDPSTTSSNHTVSLTDSSAALSAQVDLHSMTQITVSAGSTPDIDWTEVTTDGLGATIDWTAVSELWIARFDSLSVTQLEEQFLDLELIYDEVYTVQMYGEDGIAVTEATTASGTAFSGFTAGSTWLLALRCNLCTSPAPPFLTVVNVE